MMNHAATTTVTPTITAATTTIPSRTAMNIVVDSSSCRSVIRGMVFIDVPQGPVHVDSLCLSFIGCIETVHSEAISRDNFVKIESNLLSGASKSLLSGHYELPFQLALPQGLPCTYFLGQDKIMNFLSYNITYHLKASLHRNHNAFFGTNRVSEETTATLVLLEPRFQLTPLYIPPNPIRVKVLQLFSKGSLSLGIRLKSIHATPNETIRIFYALSYDPTIAINGIRVSLHQKYWDNELVSCLGVKAAEVRSLSCNAESRFALLTECLERGENFVDFKIPSSCEANFQTSFTGAVFPSVAHSLRVEVITPVFVSNPRVECNLVIHSTSSAITAATKKHEYRRALVEGCCSTKDVFIHQM